MDEDAPNFIVALVINIIIYIVIPLIMAYRRGYLFNISEHFIWIKGLFGKKNQWLPTEWTVTGIRQLSAFEKYQIKKIVVKLMSYNREEYYGVIQLKSGNTIEYQLGENKGYWNDDEIPTNKILLRKWQKGTQYKYDIIPIKEHE